MGVEGAILGDFFGSSLGWNGRRGTELLDELRRGLAIDLGLSEGVTHLLQRLVVHEAGGIFGEIKLPALDLFTELPTEG